MQEFLIIFSVTHHFYFSKSKLPKNTVIGSAVQHSRMELINANYPPSISQYQLNL